MVHIAIVEDDDHDLKQIKAYMNTFMQENGIAITTEIFLDGNHFMFDYQPVYDIILMDIEMPGMDGMTAAGKLRELDENVILIFITNMAQYAIKGYAVRARSYILKPVNYYSFALELGSAIESLEKRKDDTMLVQCEEGLRKLLIGDIYFVESQKHQMLIHTKTDVIKIRETMKNMEKKLADYYFERCNVSYLVNLTHVSGISGDMLRIGGEQVPISRQKRKSLIAALSAYIGGI